MDALVEKKVDLEVKIIRADGTVEERGVVASTHPREGQGQVTIQEDQ